MLRSRTTIHDVARASGVSATTVSHVSSGSRPVRQETAIRVKRTIELLGYQPRHSAVSLRRGTTDMIGLIVPDIANGYFATLAHGVADGAERHGLGVSLFLSDWRTDRELRYLAAIQRGAVDALIYAAGAPPHGSNVKAVAAAHLLAVVDEDIDGLGVITVLADNLKGGRLVGQHLRDLGHDSVLHISGPRELATSNRREEGFRSAFRGNENARLTTRIGDYRFPSGHSAVAAELAEYGPWFTAVFAANDVMALGALRALREHGLNVPEDVSVVGYDDITIPSLELRLSTVHQPVYEIGRSAADQVAVALASPMSTPSSRTVLDVMFIQGATSAPRGPLPTQRRPLNSHDRNDRRPS